MKSDTENCETCYYGRCIGEFELLNCKYNPKPMEINWNTGDWCGKWKPKTETEEK